MPETMTEALIACIKACGGSKQVGPLLWPEKTPDGAQRLLLDCLNDDRPAKLDHDQVLLILRMARDRGCHVGMQYIAHSLSYTEPVPLEPRDEVAELQRQYIEAARTMARMGERIERLSGPAVRVVA